MLTVPVPAPTSLGEPRGSSSEKDGADVKAIQNLKSAHISIDFFYGISMMWPLGRIRV